MKKRVSFSEYACLLALIASCRSEDPDTKVGCSVLNKEGRVLSLGYNGLKSGFSYNKKWPREEKNKYFIHAEENALNLISLKDNPYMIGLTISPCSSCAKKIASMNIKQVFFLEEYHREQGFIDIFDFYNVYYRKISLNDIEVYKYMSVIQNKQFSKNEQGRQKRKAKALKKGKCKKRNKDFYCCQK